MTQHTTPGHNSPPVTQFTMIPDSLIMDDKLTPTAYKLMCYILKRDTIKPKWIYRKADIMAVLGISDDRTWRAARDLLVAEGYVINTAKNTREIDFEVCRMKFDDMPVNPRAKIGAENVPKEDIGANNVPTIGAENVPSIGAKNALLSHTDINQTEYTHKVPKEEGLTQNKEVEDKAKYIINAMDSEGFVSKQKLQTVLPLEPGVFSVLKSSGFNPSQEDEGLRFH